LPDTDEIPAEPIQEEDEILLSTTSLIIFGITKKFLISGRRLFLYKFTKQVIKQTVTIIVGYHCY
jgi:hypothetical protein